MQKIVLMTVMVEESVDAEVIKMPNRSIMKTLMRKTVLMITMKLMVMVMVVSVMIIFHNGAACCCARGEAPFFAAQAAEFSVSWEQTFFAARVAACCHCRPSAAAVHRNRWQGA